MAWLIRSLAHGPQSVTDLKAAAGDGASIGDIPGTQTQATDAGVVVMDDDGLFQLAPA
jgi:hypothetical protein